MIRLGLHQGKSFLAKVRPSRNYPSVEQCSDPPNLCRCVFLDSPMQGKRLFTVSFPAAEIPLRTRGRKTPFLLKHLQTAPVRNFLELVETFRWNNTYGRPKLSGSVIRSRFFLMPVFNHQEKKVREAWPLALYYALFRGPHRYPLRHHSSTRHCLLSQLCPRAIYIWLYIAVTHEHNRRCMLTSSLRPSALRRNEWLSDVELFPGPRNSSHVKQTALCPQWHWSKEHFFTRFLSYDLPCSYQLESLAFSNLVLLVTVIQYSCRN